jgi:hypothetical protein
MQAIKYFPTAEFPLRLIYNVIAACEENIFAGINDYQLDTTIQITVREEKTYLSIYILSQLLFKLQQTSS